MEKEFKIVVDLPEELQISKLFEDWINLINSQKELIDIFDKYVIVEGIVKFQFRGGLENPTTETVELLNIE